MVEMVTNIPVCVVNVEVVFSPLKHACVCDRAYMCECTRILARMRDPFYDLFMGVCIGD